MMQFNFNKQFCQYLIMCIFMCFSPMSTVMGHGMMTPDKDFHPVQEFPPIEDDIKALMQYGGRAQAAGKRLVEQGEIILDQAHAVLQSQTAPFPQKMQLITVLGEIADPSSAVEIIDAAKDSSDSRYLYQNALLALGKFQPTDDIVDFSNKQLEDENRDPLIQRSAMAYFAQQPHADALKWAEKYSQPNANPDVRFAALYMGAMQGMDDMKDNIVQMLNSKQNRARQYYLLLGLVEVTDLAEFQALTKDMDLYEVNREKIQPYLLFRKGDIKQRESLAKDILNKGDINQKQAVIDYLIEQKNADVLADYWRLLDGFVRGNVKRAGYEIEFTDEGAQLHERDLGHTNFWMIWPFVILLISMTWFFYRKRAE